VTKACVDVVQVHVLCYNAVLDACRVTGRWEMALGVLRRMQDEGQRPGFINYSRAMEVG
jgi:pentatricopeptide repeat protein